MPSNAELQKDVEKLQNLVKEKEKQKTEAVDKQVQLENQMEAANKLLAEQKAQLDTMNQNVKELQDKLVHMQNRLTQEQRAKSTDFSITPEVLATLTMLAVPFTRNANGIPWTPERAENELKMLAERSIAPALRVVREVVNQIHGMKPGDIGIPPE